MIAAHSHQLLHEGNLPASDKHPGRLYGNETG
jgi:hypothetical protein